VGAALALATLGWLAATVPAVALAATNHRSAARRIGPEAVWKQALADQLPAWKGCRRPLPGEDRACFARFMRAHGASPQAASFLDATSSYLIAFINTGEVDLGFTLSSFPANDDLGYLLLNSSKQYFHPPLPSLASPSYAKLRHAYRLPAGQTALTVVTDSIVPWLEKTSRPSAGDEEIVLQFPLYDGCAACTTSYRARIGYWFSARGAFAGTVPLGPCLSRGHRGRSTNVQEPVCPSVSAVHT
jgi:hypothetical protein